MASRWLAPTLTLLVTSACCHRPEGEPPAAGPGRQNAASTQPTVAAAVPQPMQTAPRVGNPFEGVVFFRNPEYTRPCPTCPSISTRRMQVGSGGRAIPRSWRQSSRMCWSERAARTRYKIRGAATNVSNYNAVSGADGKKLGPVNPCLDELSYVQQLSGVLASAGMADMAFIIDTSRNGRVVRIRRHLRPPSREVRRELSIRRRHAWSS